MGQPFDPKKAFFYGQFVRAAYTVSGHSLGGALRTLFVMNATRHKFDRTALYIFASPSVSNKKFTQQI